MSCDVRFCFGGSSSAIKGWSLPLAPSAATWRTLVSGLLARQVWCVAQVPHPGCERRFLLREPVPGG